MSQIEKSTKIKCAGCNSPIGIDKPLLCSNKKCNLKYHIGCVGGMAPAGNAIATWICPICVCNKKRTGDNSSTPVRLHLPTQEESHNVTQRSRGPSPSTPIYSELTEIMDEIRSMRTDMSQIRDQLNSLTVSISQCQESISSFSEFYTDTRTRLQHLEEKQLEVIELKCQVTQLNDNLNALSQSALKNEIEIIGIPELPNENLEHTTLIIAQKIGVTLKSDDIDWVSRAGPKKLQKQPEEAPNSSENRPISRPVVIRLIRKAKRDEILKSARVRRNISPKDIEVGKSTNKIYFNERLTAENRRLFRETRIRARQLAFKYCWINNGTIHVRKEEGRGFPAIQIKNWASLEDKLMLPPSSLHNL